jgi:hypothetical protein
VRVSGRLRDAVSEELPTGADVARFLGRASDAEFVKLADQHIPLVTSFIRAYTRGRGFDDDSEEVEDDVRAVIITATARLVVNPAQVSRESVDGYSAVGSLNGFTLPELAVLHLYRRRTT